jgi:replicative DNA helicase
VVDLFGRSQEALNGLMMMATKGSRVNFDHWLQEASREVMELSENQEGFSGVTLGLEDLNQLTGGAKPGDLIILAGRPGMGKTAKAIRILRQAVKSKKRAAFFSWEMSEQSLVKRLMASEADTLHANQFFQHGLRKPEYYKEFDEIMGRLEALSDDIYIERATVNIRELRMKLMSLHKEQPLDLILVDYLQLIPGAGSNYQGKREQEVSEVSRGLKQIALELDVPVIALAQLSREVEKRPTKRPMLSDLRDSGSIEQDADLVIFLYRPEYYKFETWDDGSSCKNQAEIICAKQRNGKLGSVYSGFDSNRVRFCELSEIESADNLKMLKE